MREFTVESPDGRRIKVMAKDRETAIRGAQEYARANPPKLTFRDAAKSIGSGLMRAAGGLAEMGPQGQVARAYNSVIDAVGAPKAMRTQTPGEIAERHGGGYRPRTRATRYLKTGAEFAPNALMPARMVQRVVQTAVPAAASETAGQIVEAVTDNPYVQGGARIAGAIFGGGVGVSRAAKPMAQSSPANVLAARAPQSVPTMRQNALEYQQAGIQPTLVDVVDEGGRTMLRAAATRPPARQPARDFAERRRLDLPDRMGGQARRNLSADPRNPREIAEDLGTSRRDNAKQNFGAVRGEVVEMAPETVSALRTDIGRDAIRLAAQRERDPETRRQLLMLADAALDAPSTPITVGMADRISRVLLSKAEAAAAKNDPDLATTYRELGQSVRRPTASAVPGYRTSLDEYAADSALLEAGTLGEKFLSMNADEFAAEVAKLTPEGKQVALATARRAVERAAGENVSNAPGVARRIATAPEQMRRNVALAPDPAALQSGMAMEARAVQNAADINPRTGSQTHSNQDAAGRLAEAAPTVGKAFVGNWTGVAMDWLRSRGISDADALRLTEAATDPAALEGVFRALEARIGAQEAQRFLQMRGAALGGATAALTAPLPEQ